MLRILSSKPAPSPIIVERERAREHRNALTQTCLPCRLSVLLLWALNTTGTAAMLRYPATTLSLTMTEVKQYNRRRRFKQYHEMGEARGPKPPRPVFAASGPPLATEPAGRNEESRECKIEGSEDTIMIPDDMSTPKYLLASRPRRPPKSNELERSNPSTPTALDGSHSSEADSIHEHGEPSASYATRLPPPFSESIRLVSDEHSMPSVGSWRLLCAAWSSRWLGTPTSEPGTTRGRGLDW
jgi:hypothetical protein